MFTVSGVAARCCHVKETVKKFEAKRAPCECGLRPSENAFDWSFVRWMCKVSDWKLLCEVTPTSRGVSATRLLSAARVLPKATTTLCTALERFPSSHGPLTPAFCALSLCTYAMNRLHFLLQTRVVVFFPPHISIKSTNAAHTESGDSVCVWKRE